MLQVFNLLRIAHASAVVGCGVLFLLHLADIFCILIQIPPDSSDTFIGMARMLILFSLIATCCRYGAGVDRSNYNRGD